MALRNKLTAANNKNGFFAQRTMDHDGAKAGVWIEPTLRLGGVL